MAFPIVAIVTKSIIFVKFGLLVPPANTTLVGDAVDAGILVAAVKSPKSEAFPVVAIVTNSIELGVEGEYPPPKIALTALLEGPNPPPLLATVVSPKSTAFPVDAIVTN